ncbi:hypothetical protein Tco_0065015 [Tanacetum coccineum]
MSFNCVPTNNSGGRISEMFPNIPKRIKEDYHSIKDDIPLVSVYTTGNVSVREMLISDAFLTKKRLGELMILRVMETVFIEGTNRNTPRAHRSPTVFANPLEMKKRRQTAGESSSPRKSLKITIKKRQIVEKDDDDTEDRIEPRSHKDNLKFIDDDDDKAEEKNSDDMGSLEIRNEETQTTIPIPLSALRRMCRRQGYMIQDMERKCITTAKFWETHNKIDDILHEIIPQIAKNVTDDLIEANLKLCIANIIIEDHDSFRSEVPAFVSQEFNAHAPAIIEELFKNYVQSNVVHVHPTTTTSTETESSATLQYQLYLKMKRSLQDRADDIALWEALRRKFKKSSPSNTSCREDYFHSQHDEHQDDDAPPEGEKIVKKIRGHKDQSLQEVLCQSLQEENVIDEDEVIPEDETPELIVEFQDVNKRVPTIFDHARMEATLRDSISNLSRNAEEYAYHLEQSTSFMENQIEKKYILSLHKIHAEEFLEPDLEEKLNRWVQKEFKTFNEDARLSIQHWKDSWHKRVYKQNQKKVRKNLEDYYSNHRITEVVRIVTDQPHGLDFMEQILVMRATTIKTKTEFF